MVENFPLRLTPLFAQRCWVAALWAFASIFEPSIALGQEGIQLLPYSVSYTSADGLPSSEVHELFQDRDRNIWFCTSNGISFFDGNKFQTIPLSEGLQSHVIIHGLKDENDRLWFCTSLTEFFSLEPVTRALKIYDFNETINEYMIHALVNDFYLNDDTLHFWSFAHKYGRVVFDHARDSTLSAVFQNSDTAFYLQKIDEANYAYGARPSQFNAYMTNRIGPSGERPYSERPVRMSVIPHEHGVIATCGRLLMDLDMQFNMTHHQLERVDFSGCMTKKNETDFWVGTHAHGAILYRFQDGGFTEIRQVLDGYMITDILEDDEGGLWISTPSHGVFYFPTLDNYQLSLNHTPHSTIIYSMFIGPDENCALFSKSDNTLYLLNADPVLRIESMLETSGQLEIHGYDTFISAWLIRMQHASRVLDHSENFNFKILQGTWFRDSTNRQFYISTGPETALLDTFLQPIKVLNSNRKIGSIRHLSQIDKHRYYVSDYLNVCIYDHLNQRLDEVLPVNEPSSLARISNVLAVNKDLILATDGSGLKHVSATGISDLKAIGGSSALEFSTSVCLVPGKPDCFYAGTNEGLFKIRVTGNEYEILTRYSPETGHPYRNVQRLLAYDEYLIVACENQSFITRLSYLNEAKDSINFIVDKVTGSDEEVFIHGDGLYHFDATAVKIEFKFHNHTFRNARLHQFRYRIPELSASWIYTNRSSITLTGLAAGKYSLDIDAMDTKGQWASTPPIAMIVHPPWFLESWMVVLYIALLAFIITWLVRWRIGQIRRQTSLQNQVVLATNKTLGAQLNPHFLYNVLNTVGGNLVDGNLDQSLDTISKFARLMRKVFANSQEDFVSLERELTALLEYTDLEKMRLKEKFDFSLNIDPATDTSALLVPPLFLQPLVENAIWHGVSKTSEQGKVLLKVSIDGRTISFEIYDNGPGFENTQKRKERQAKSSLDILKERINLLNRTHENTSKLDFSSIEHPDYATVVTLKLPFKKISS